jgi:hypothetical protein
VWRIISAQEGKSVSAERFGAVLRFIGSILPREVPENVLFSEIAALQHCINAADHSEQKVLELIAVLRALIALGYVDVQEVPFSRGAIVKTGVYEKKEIVEILQHLHVLSKFVNNALLRM